MKYLFALFSVLFYMNFNHVETAQGDLRDFMKFTENWEGRKHSAYNDKGGFAIGVGHHFKDKKQFTKKLTNKEIDALLEKDMKQAVADAKTIIKNFDSLPYQVRLIVADMSFNLGIIKFSKFKKAIDACHNQDWSRMADELENSLWYKQVNRRSKHHVDTLRQLAQTENQLARN